MKRYVAALLLLSYAAAAHALPVTIADNFVGGTPTSAAYSGLDVIGDANDFGISSMDVTVSGTLLTVEIFATYFDNVGKYGTEMGDLFISTNGWHPFGSAPYASDTASNGEAWEYALVLSNHGEAYAAAGTPTSMLGGSGTVNLYQVVDPALIELSSAPPGYIFRANQEVQFNPGNSPSLATGTWSIADLNGGTDKLAIQVNFGNLFSGADLGFHWAFTCANDVIEGGSAVPEPATIVLLGAGLLGGFRLRRRA